MRRAVLVVCVLSLSSATGLAAGMFVTPHGARPLGRGGAFVAGADDLNAIYYNPAGVADIPFAATGWSGLLDGAFVLQNVTYTRDENGLLRPPVTADGGVLLGGPLLIPQAAFSRKMQRSWGSMSFGLGLWIPYTGLPRYPEPDYGTPGDPPEVIEEKLARVPEVAPQRYALIGLHDGNLAQSTLLAVLNPVGAISILRDKILIGIGPQLMLAYFRTRIMLSGCTGVMCRPEQPDYDTLVLAQAFALVPSANLGLIGKPWPWLRLGLALQLPFAVRSLAGSVDARLPVNELFNGAYIVGRSASMAIDLPPVLRLGAELRPLQNDRLRIELAYTLEGWAMQQEVTFTPHDIAIENIKAIGRYELGPIALPRRMVNTHSIHLGLEWHAWKYLAARAGGMFETSAMPDETVTVLTPDNHKGLVSIGLALPGVRLLRTEWRFDVSYGRIIQPDRTVAPLDSRIFPGNPLRPPQQMPAEIGGIGGGLYQVSYDLVAVGLSAVR
ncbi:MAG: outer membrane protein transport protein [Myxococcales bacterium]|nr:outer membrane protein transport protein [Myxococcota bacterium]MDW8280446.1 outer membrane protein transport protein [Myxococcales bacterium]